jgi:hyperosmotically inducible protein
MRLIRRLLLLALVGTAAVVAFNWSGQGPSVLPRTAALNAEAATRHAVTLANRAATTATNVSAKFGGTVSEGALTAKIKSKMALDDYIEAGAIDVDTSGTTVTLTGVVRSADERDRALRLARETEGVTKVIDKLRIRKS